MKISTYKKWMLESYLYEAGEFKARSVATKQIVYYDTKDELKAAIKGGKVEPIEKGDKEKGKEEPETKPDTTDQDSKDTEKGEKPSGEEPSGEEPSGEEPKKGVFDKPGSGKADDYLGGDDEEPSGEEPMEPDEQAYNDIAEFLDSYGDNLPDKEKQELEDMMDGVQDGEVSPDEVRKKLDDLEVQGQEGGFDEPEGEPSGEEPSAEIPKPKREPVKVNYDGKSGEKGSTGKGATGRWAAWHGYSGKSAGFDQPEAAEAWASGAYDNPEDAIKVGKAAEEKRIAASKKEAAESAADIKKEVENAPPEVKSWYEEKVGSKIDKVLDFFEDLQSNEGPGKEESVKVINGKKYRAIKESKKHPLKEQYDRLFTNRTII